MQTRIARTTLASILCASLAVSGAPTAAMADTSDALKQKLSAAQTELNSLYEEAELVSENLNKTVADLDQTKTRIVDNEKKSAEKQVELDEASETLKQVVAQDYKTGGVSLMSLVMGADTLDELISRIHAANKVSEHQQQVIHTVNNAREELKTARDELEKDRAAQEELVAQQEAQQAELDASIAASEDYVSNLDVQVQEAMAKEEAERRAAEEREAKEALKRAEEEKAAQEAAQKEAEEAKAAEEATKQESEDQPEQTKPEEQEGPANEDSEDEDSSLDDQSSEEDANTSTDDSTSTVDPSSADNTDSTADDTPDSDSTNSETEPDNQSSSNSDIASIIISAALAQVGKPYVWGLSDPNVGFDCSGLTMYCYGCAGIEITHWSEGQGALCDKPASEAVAGDIVWKYGHVGLCIGNGVTIEAFNPARGVGYGTIDRFERAGSPGW